ncbi:MAG: hypothetical protein JWN51_161 [Phycisphaerales bacterium]|jgi:hypothetical protein|nr:hypothetical protein [Phycisphaerales bacterium]
MTGFTVPTLACADWTYSIPIRVDGFQYDLEVDVDDDDARVLPVEDLAKLKTLVDSWEKDSSKARNKRGRGS